MEDLAKYIMTFQFEILLQVSGLTSERAAALIPAAAGLISLIVGSIVLARSRIRIGHSKAGAIVALLLGVIGLVWSVTHLVRTSSSNIGTGSGRLGAIVALVLALVGIGLGVVALTRSKKNHLKQ